MLTRARAARIQASEACRILHACRNLAQLGGDGSDVGAAPSSEAAPIRELIDILIDAKSGKIRDTSDGSKIHQQSPLLASSSLIKTSNESRPSTSLPKPPKPMRHKERVQVNRFTIQTFTNLERSLRDKSYTNQQKLELIQQALDSMSRLVYRYELDPVNISSFIHRLSRLLINPTAKKLRSDINYKPLLYTLVELMDARLEIQLQLLDNNNKSVDDDTNASTTVKKLVIADPIDIVAQQQQQALQGDDAVETGWSNLRALTTAFLSLGWVQYDLSAAQLERIAAVLMQRYEVLDLTTVSTALNAFRLFSHQPFQGRIFQALLGKILDFPDRFIVDHSYGAQTAIDILYAAAETKASLSQEVAAKLLSVVTLTLPSMTSHQLALLSVALGKNRISAVDYKDVWSALRDAVWLRLRDDANYIDVSMMGHGFDLAGFKPGPLFMHAVGAKAARDLDTMGPNDMANMLWFFATQTYYPKPFIKQPRRSTSSLVQRDESSLARSIAASETILDNKDSNDARINTLNTSSHEEKDEQDDDEDRELPTLTFRELQQRALERKLERRRLGLIDDDDTDDNAIRNSLVAPSSDRINTDGLAERVEGAQAKRSELVGLIKIAEEVARKARQSLATSSNSSSTIDKVQSAGSSSKSRYKGKNKPARKPGAGQQEPVAPHMVEAQQAASKAMTEADARLLAWSIFTGKRAIPPKSSNASNNNPATEMPRRTRQRIVKVGDAVTAEVSLDPISGRVVMQTHYNLDSIFGGRNSDDNDPTDDESSESSLGSMIDSLFDVQRKNSSIDADKAMESDDEDNEDDDTTTTTTNNTIQVDPEKQLQHTREQWAAQQGVSMDMITTTALERMNDFSPSDAVTLGISCAILQHYNEELLQATLQRVLSSRGSDVESIPPYKYQWFLWALAVMGCKVTTQDVDILVKRSLASPVESPVESTVHAGSTVARLCWSLCAMGRLTPETFTELVSSIRGGSKAAKLMNVADLSKLYHCSLMLEATTSHKNKNSILELIPNNPELAEAARAAWHSRSENVTTSRVQKHVASVLKHTTGLVGLLEYEPEGSPLVIDIAVYGPSGEKIAVEVDGPHHFAANMPDMPLANTRLRDKLLEHHGWKVVGISARKWLNMNEFEQAEYLKKRINEHLMTRV